MADHPLLICGYDIRAGGRQVNSLCEEDVRRGGFQGDDGYRWIHCHLEETDDFPSLPDFAKMPSLIAEAMHAAETRPRFMPMGNEFLLILRGVNLNPEADPEDMVSIRLWVTANLIISVRRRRLLAIDDLRQEIAAGRAPPTPARLVTELAFSLTDRMEPTIDGLSDQVDELEDLSLNHKSDRLRQKLPDLRRKAIMLRRYIAPQREAINRMTLDTTPLFTEHDRQLMREASDRVLRFVEELDSVRERSNVLHDQLTDQRAEEMNRTMLVLAVVAAIFLPLGLLTGLLGINVGGMPGADNPAAFWIVTAAMILLALGELWLFRRMKWI